METKKTWENAPSALIPKVRLLHCPYIRISNESLPTSAEIYANTTANVVPPKRHTYGYTYPMLPIYAKIVRPTMGEYTLLYIKGKVSRRKI